MGDEQIPDVRKSVVVAASPERCFETFTERMADWWPPSHVLLRTPRVGLAMDPKVDGRYYEWDAEGNEIDWGKVLEWDPPRRLRLTWRIDGRWQSIPDDERASEIEVVFTPLEDGSTRVELAHVRLDKHGADGRRIFQALDGPSPGETLELFARAVR
ncbi:SRPBCC family protein [Streptomyces rubiginosohelvolus]|uniref:SRPBCC family protein n=1 Tax=Streptomyces TaxID=1883 RepID=UPI00190E3934|nr:MULTISPECIES: SRPBCC family protein [unclassified Streptomyces]MBK3528129.1 SRPBCC family protein [Streptomyces sp. MBT72]MBK3535350.1 SRPBCC family protein [Streptomyces sp. MBT67]MBK3548236.1 SRPBCC family protein [Streptomyces sp. MBT61]MBK6028043.1 SRPBCC family protein [Streptomyces sp. MBT59]